MHTEASRRTRPAILRSQLITARSPISASTPRPPTTISVSTLPRNEPNVVSGRKRNPEDAAIGPALVPTTASE